MLQYIYGSIPRTKGGFHVSVGKGSRLICHTGSAQHSVLEGGTAG